MKTLVVYSGGLDSAVCLAKACSEHVDIKEVTAISFEYGQKNHGELKAAETLCRWWGVKRVVRTVTVEGTGDTEKELPARNTVFLAHALSYAIENKIDRVYVGWEPGSVYKDSAPEYIALMLNVYKLHGVTLAAPVKDNKDKTETLKQALELGVPLDMVHSCLREEVCYECSTCRKMEKACQELFPRLAWTGESRTPVPLIWKTIRDEVRESRGEGRLIASRRSGSFKYLPAFFALARHRDPPTADYKGLRVYTTGNWGASLMSVFARYPYLQPDEITFDFAVHDPTTCAGFVHSMFNTDLEGARWGTYQALGHLARRSTVTGRITQGHLRDACVHVGLSWGGTNAVTLITQE